MELALQYYSDIHHWDVFVEPAVLMEEDTVFDKFGLKHAYFVNRYYYFAVPQKAGYRFLPDRIGPFLYAYGQKMPVEGKDNAYFQMIRSAVFPFASEASAEVSSKTLFQQYADARLDADILHIDSLIFLYVKQIHAYNLFDSVPYQNENDQEENRSYNDWGDLYRRHHSFDCLVGECLNQYEINEKPHQDLYFNKITEETLYKDLTSKGNIEELKKKAVMAKNGFYLVPPRSILTAIAKNVGFFNEITSILLPLYDYEYFGKTYSEPCYCYEGNVSEHMIYNMMSGDCYYYGSYGDYYSENEDDFTSTTYYLMNNQTIFLYHEELDYDAMGDGALYFSDLGEPTILAITPNGTKSIAISDWLKDTNCTVSFPPPVIHVRVEKEKHDYSKEAILQYLKEGSALYDFFANDYDKYVEDDEYYRGIEYDIDCYDTISLTVAQCKKITKLLQEIERLQYQANVIENKIDVLKGQIPSKNKFYLTKNKSYGMKWELCTKGSQYQDENKKIEKQRRKLYSILKKINGVEDEIEKITERDTYIPQIKYFSPVRARF